jgi:hypothetical protein
MVNTFVFGQEDSTFKIQSLKTSKVYAGADSVSIAKWKLKQDSIKKVRDSLSMVWIKYPDPNRPNLFVDSLVSLYKVEKFDFRAWAKKFSRKKDQYSEGIPRTYRESWLILVVLFLVLFFGIIRYFFQSELNTIIRVFYSNQKLGKINKEDNLFSSWGFLFFYILFGFITGLYLYLSGRSLGISYSEQGFTLFLYLSAAVITLFTIKIIVLRIIGFLFDASRIVGDYVSVLHLSYFNTALLFLPVVIAFSLSSSRFFFVYSYIGLILLFLIIVFQFIKIAKNILSNYKFPKVYLIIYLCALEFCPLIILFKALGY